MNRLRSKSPKTLRRSEPEKTPHLEERESLFSTFLLSLE